jgi:hypothetical protein
MSWGEAYSVWNSIQTTKNRQADYLKAVSNNQQQLQNQTQATGLRLAAAALLARALVGLAGMTQSVGRLLSLPVRLAGQLTDGVRTTLSAMMRTLPGGQPTLNALQRLGSMLGDARQMLEEILARNVEHLKKLMVRAQWVQRLFSPENMKALASQLAKAFARNPILRTVGKAVKSILGKLRRWFGDETQEESLKD